MKNIFILISFLFISNILNAQTAQEWLDKVSNTYHSIPTYYIKFEVKESDNPKAETGELFAAKDKFSLDVMGISQMYDGKKLYTVQKEDKEVTVSSPAADSDDLLTPTKVLKMYKSGFNASLDKSATIAGKKIQYIKLKPTGNSETDFITVGIDKEKSTLYEYKESYKNGSSRTITVKDYLENLIIPRTLFKFDQSKYENDGYIVTRI